MANHDSNLYINWKDMKTKQRIVISRQNNSSNKVIYEIVEALEKTKPLYKTIDYKEGYSDCIHLLKRALTNYLPK